MKSEKKWGLYKKSIISRDGDDSPYLIRYNLFECPWFSIKIHKILQDDRDCPHDHPWAFFSIILKGGYIEWIPVQQEAGEGWIYVVDVTGGQQEKGKLFRAGTILYRPADWIHRLELRARYVGAVRYLGVLTAPATKSVPATTLVITFKKVREWGFWTKRGFVKWFNYHAKNKCE